MNNTISAIYVISTNEILFSRAVHDCVVSADGRSHIDGGREYTKISGWIENVIEIELDKNCLLDFILYMDYNYKNKQAKKFPQGYHGRFQIVKSSNEKFYRKLIVDYYRVAEYIEKVTGGNVNGA